MHALRWPGVDTREDLQLMTENKSRGIFGRSALRAGAAGLTLALAASLAPGFISWSNPAPRPLRKTQSIPLVSG